MQTIPRFETYIVNGEWIVEIIEDEKPEEKKYPLLAIVVSDRLQRCEEFLRFNGLNRRCFKCVAQDYHQLAGYSLDTPIIITYYEPSQKMYEMLDFIHYRFKNVRYIDY